MKYYNKSKDLIPVYSQFGRVVGAIEGKTLRKHAKGSKHMLRRPHGWAWDKSILTQAEKARVTDVEIIDVESGIVYHSNLDAYGKYGVSLDHGYGSQTCLPLEYWKISDVNPRLNSAK